MSFTTNITCTQCASPSCDGKAHEPARTCECGYPTDRPSGVCGLCQPVPPAEQRFKTVTRTFFEGTRFDDKGNMRDTRHLTRDELSSYLRAIQTDADEFGVHGSVNVNGAPYASFDRAAYSPIPRCPRCTVRHFTRCLSAPDPSECQHDFSVMVSMPNRLMGYVHSYTAMRQCRHCDEYRAESAFKPITVTCACGAEFGSASEYDSHVSGH